MTASAAQPREWTVTLPYTAPPLTLNQRLHWAEKARRVRELREAVEWKLREARVPPLRRCSVELHWRPGMTRTRDRDNLTATSKPCFDEIVAAGICADDSPEWMDQLMPVIHPADRRLPPVLWIVIREVP